MIGWEFKENAEVQGSSDGFWYGIKEGCINPKAVLENMAQVEALDHAIEIVSSFEMALEQSGYLIEF